LEVKPHSVVCLNDYALLLMDEFGEYDEARLIFENVMKLDTSRADAHHNLSLLMKEHFNATIFETFPILLAGLRINPMHPNIHYDLANMFYHRNPTVALHCFDQALLYASKEDHRRILRYRSFLKDHVPDECELLDVTNDLLKLSGAGEEAIVDALAKMTNGFAQYFLKFHNVYDLEEWSFNVLSEMLHVRHLPQRIIMLMHDFAFHLPFVQYSEFFRDEFKF